MVERDKRKEIMDSIVSDIRMSSSQSTAPQQTHQHDVMDSIVAELKTKGYREQVPMEDDSEGNLITRGINTAIEGVSKPFELLDVPYEQLGKPAVGWISQQAARHGLQRTSETPGERHEIFGIEIPGTGTTITPEQSQRIAEADSPTEAFDIRMEHEGGISQFATRMGADPLNLVGAGLGRAAVSSARAGRASQLLDPVSRLGRTADTIADVDNLIGEALALPITVPVRGVARAGRAVGLHRGPDGLLRPSSEQELRTAGRKITSFTEEEVLRDRVDLLTEQRIGQLRDSIFEQTDEGIRLSQQGLEHFQNEQVNPYDVVQLIERDEFSRNILLGNDEVRDRLISSGVLNTDLQVTSFGRAHSELNNALLAAGVDRESLSAAHRTLFHLDHVIPSVASTWSETKFTTSGKFYRNLNITSNLDEATQFVMNRKDGQFYLNIGRDSDLYTINREMLGGLFTELGGTKQDFALLNSSMGGEVTKHELGESIIDFFRTHDFSDERLNSFANSIAQEFSGMPLSGARSLGQRGKELVAARFSDTFFDDIPDAARLYRMKRWRKRTGRPVAGWGEEGFPQTREQLMRRHGFVGRQQQESRRAAFEAAQEGRGRISFTEKEPLLTSADRNKWMSSLADDAPPEVYFARMLEAEQLPVEQAERVIAQLQPVIDRNADYFRAGFLLENQQFQDNFIRAVRDPDNSRAYLAQAVEALNLEQEARGVRNPLIGFLGRMSGVGRKVSMPYESGRFGKITDVMLREEREYLQKVLDPGNEFVQEFVTDWQRNARIVDSAVDRVRQEIPVSGLSETTTFAQLAENPQTRQLFSEEEWRSLENAFEHIGGIRGSVERANTFRTQLARNWMDDMGISMGVRDRATILKRRSEAEGIAELKYNGLRQEFQRATSAWREQALGSVRYHMTNGLDMIVKSAVHGIYINPVNSQGSAFDAAKVWGMDAIPHPIRDSIVRDASMLAQAQLPGGQVNLANYATRFGMPRVGNALNWAVTKNRTLAMWMETSARAAAWKTAMERHLLNAHPRFMNQLTNDLRRTGVDDVAIQRIQSFMDGHVRYNPQQVHDWLIRNGVDNTTAAQQAGVWRGLLREGSSEGERMALKVHFDFASETVLEEKLKVRHLLPFHIWATRNIPFYLQTMAQNPWIMRVYRRWNEASEEEQEDLGLTARFREKVMLPDLGPANGIISLFLGPGHHAYNPLISFSIFDQLKEPYIPDEGGGVSQVGQTIAQGRRFGFSFAPWIDLPLNVFGVYGTQEPFGLWRQGDPIAGGIDAATHEASQHLGTPPTHIQDIRPTVRIVQGLRNALGGLTGTPRVDTITGSPRTDAAINRRIREMALEETGDGQHPAYTLAMVDPDSEIYRRASRDARQQLWRNTMQSFLHSFPTAHARDTEVETRRLSPRLEFGEMPDHIMSYLRDSGHPSTQLWRTRDDEKRAQIDAGWVIMMDDRIPYEQRMPLIEQLGLNWFIDYFAWRNAQPEGVDVSADKWMKTVR